MPQLKVVKAINWGYIPHMEDLTDNSAIGRLAASGARICFLNNNRAWGGGENWHLGAARYFAERGCRVILSGRPDGALYRKGLELLAGRPELATYFEVSSWYFSNLDFLNIPKMRRFAGFLRGNSVTHLVTGQTVDMKASVIAARGSGTKVYYRRGLAFPVKDSWLNRRCYNALEALVVNSRATAAGVLKNRGMIAADKVRVIYNGLDIPAFDDALEKYEASRPAVPPLWDGASRPLVIGNAGRLTEQKGQKYLLHMSAELKRRGMRCRLVIAGEGELERELAAEASCLGLVLGKNPGDDADVIMPGFMGDLSPFWHSIDFFVLSSLWEGFGYVLAEAMLARKAVCAFDINSMPELVANGENGFLLPPPADGESDSAVGARLADVISLIMNEPEKMRAMGEAGRRICTSRFDRRIVMEELAMVLLGS